MEDCIGSQRPQRIVQLDEEEEEEESKKKK
jgi:hypothetical protein